MDVHRSPPDSDQQQLPAERWGTVGRVGFGCAGVAGGIASLFVLLLGGIVSGLVGYAIAALFGSAVYLSLIAGGTAGLLAAVAGTPVGAFFGGLWLVRRPDPHAWSSDIPQLDRATAPLIPLLTLAISILRPDFMIVVGLLTVVAGMALFWRLDPTLAAMVAAALPLLAAGFSFAIIVWLVGADGA